MDNLSSVADSWQTRQMCLNPSETKRRFKLGPSKLWVAGSIPAGVTKLTTSKTLRFPLRGPIHFNVLIVHNYAAECGQKKALLAESATSKDTQDGDVLSLDYTDTYRLKRPDLECLEVSRG